MFTGLVEEMGAVTKIEGSSGERRITIRGEVTSQDVTLGASISISGCCLTVVQSQGPQMTFEAGQETLSRTKLGNLQVGDQVNLERALAVGDRLGGHYVTGHIDGMGQVQRREDDGQWSYFWITAPPHLMRQMASKGSVAIDGVSLTLVDVTAEAFSVALIPHTLSVTTLGMLRAGDPVHLETDVLAKYVQRQLEFLNT